MSKGKNEAHFNDYSYRTGKSQLFILLFFSNPLTPVLGSSRGPGHVSGPVRGQFGGNLGQIIKREKVGILSFSTFLFSNYKEQLYLKNKLLQSL